MALRIEIKSPFINEITGVAAKSGKPYHIRKQSGWAYTFDQNGQPNPYPERIDISIADGQEAYPPGNYMLSDKCFFVGDFNALAVGRPILEPIPARS
jgi:hypothetical protein